MRTELLAMAALLLPSAAMAQDGVLLRFRAPAGTRIQTVSDTRTNTALVGFPSVPDSTVIESDWRTVTTQRVIDVLGNARTVTAAFDTSRARARVGTGQRGDVTLEGVEGLRIRMVVSERLEPSGLSGGQSGDSAFMDALT